MGSGKSRVSYEFVEQCRVHKIVVRECRGVSHGRAVSYLPVLEFYRAIFGIEAGEDGAGPAGGDAADRERPEGGAPGGAEGGWPAGVARGGAVPG